MERKYYLRGLGLGIVMTAIIMGVALSGRKTMTDEEVIARAKELGMVENTVLADMDSGREDGSAETDDAGKDQTGNAGTGRTGDTEAVQADDTGMDGGEDAGEDQADSVGTDKANNSDSDEESRAGADDADVDKDDSNGMDKAGDAAADSADGQGGVRQQDAGQNEPDKTADAGGREQQETVNAIITSAAVKTITVNSGDGSYTVAKKLADVGVVTSAETFDSFLCQYGYDKRLRTGTFSIPADASDEQIARIVTGAE